MSLISTLLYAIRSGGRGSLAIEVPLFGLPLVYYASYLPPATTSDYRYMYPATLLLQVITALIIIGSGVRWISGRRGA